MVKFVQKEKMIMAEILNVEGLPFIATQNSKEVLREPALTMLLMDLRRAEDRAEKEGWIDVDDLERELEIYV